MIENMVLVTNFLHFREIASQLQAKPQALFICADEHGGIDREVCRMLAECYVEAGGEGEPMLMVIETGHAGRMDALLYADVEQSRLLSLEMLEDAHLYPHALNG